MARSEVAYLTEAPTRGSTCAKIVVNCTTRAIYIRDCDGNWTLVGSGGTGVITDGDYCDITITNGGSCFTIDTGVVTYAKMQAVSATNRLLGRISPGAGIIEELTPTQIRTLINVADGADVTNAANVNAAGAVMNSDTTTAAMQFVIDEDSFISNLDTKVPTQQSVKAYVDAAVAAGITDGDKGDIVVGSGGSTWLIDNDVVTYAKIQNVSTNNRILGRITAGAGNVEELTAAQVNTMLGASNRKADADTLVFAANLAFNFETGSYDNKQVVMTAALSAPTYSAVRKGYYAHSYTQDGTGGWDINWPANVVFKGAAEQPDPTPGKTTNFLSYFDGSEFLTTRI